MSIIVRSLYLLGLTCWIGGAVFFSLIVLPTLFTGLETARAGEIAALLFPRYYYVGVFLGVLLLACSAWMAAVLGRWWRPAAVLVAVMLACQAYAAFAVQPRMAGLRGRVEHRVEFDALHRRSVRLNGVVLLGGLCLVLSSGYLLAER